MEDRITVGVNWLIFLDQEKMLKKLSLQLYGTEKKVSKIIRELLDSEEFKRFVSRKLDERIKELKKKFA